MSEACRSSTAEGRGNLLERTATPVNMSPLLSPAPVSTSPWSAPMKLTVPWTPPRVASTTYRLHQLGMPFMVVASYGRTLAEPVQEFANSLVLNVCDDENHQFILFLIFLNKAMSWILWYIKYVGGVGRIYNMPRILSIRQSRPMLEILTLQQAEEARSTTSTRRATRRTTRRITRRITRLITRKNTTSSPSPPPPPPPLPASQARPAYDLSPRLDRILPPSRQPVKPLWFGMWGSISEIYPWSSIVWDSVPPSDIDQYGGPSLRFFYDVTQIFCNGDIHNCQMHPDYQQRWNNALPKAPQLLKDKKILGFWLQTK